MKRLLAALACGAALPLSLIAPPEAAAGVPEPVVVAECGPVTYTWGTKYAPCNLRPPDVLHVLGVTYSQCMQYGGTWGGTIKLKDGGSTTICRNVSY